MFFIENSAQNVEFLALEKALKIYIDELMFYTSRKYVK